MSKKEYHRKYYQKNKEKIDAQNRTWAKNNIDKLRVIKLRNRYKISEEEYVKLFDNQGGKCSICKNELKFRAKSTHLDHSHITKKIRGFLCEHCNRGLGSFKDNIELLISAIFYLNRNNNDAVRDRNH